MSHSSGPTASPVVSAQARQCTLPEAHLPAIHPGRHRGVLQDLVRGCKMGGQPRARDLRVPDGVSGHLRGQGCLHLWRERWEVHGYANGASCHSWGKLLWGDVHGEVADGREGNWGICCRERKGLGLGFCEVETEAAS